jgi:hypothetical protein
LLSNGNDWVRTYGVYLPSGWLPETNHGVQAGHRTPRGRGLVATTKGLTCLVALSVAQTALFGMFRETRLGSCFLFAGAESLGQAAIAPHSPNPQRALGGRCLCLLYLDLHGIGVLSPKVTKEEEDGSKDAVALTVAQLTDCGAHSGPSRSREDLCYDPVYTATRISLPHAEIREGTDCGCEAWKLPPGGAEPESRVSYRGLLVNRCAAAQQVSDKGVPSDFDHIDARARRYRGASTRTWGSDRNASN